MITFKKLFLIVKEKLLSSKNSLILSPLIKIYELSFELCDKLILGEHYMGKNKRKRKINYDLVIQNRVLIFLVIIVSLFGIIIFKMVDVMLFNKKIYTDNLERLSYTKVTGTSSPRGRIYDRNYNIIVEYLLLIVY